VPKIAAASKYYGLKLRKEGRTKFLETLGGSYRSAKRGRFALKFCAMGSSRPML
jgi:hypothetical protein